jgi:hypothetical protein
LDDYCPRERRVTNHAVVAMIEDEVKQTRCTTCDAEHVYKGGRVPARRKKETPGTLYKEVLASMPDQDSAPALSVPVPSDDVDIPETPAMATGSLPPSETAPASSDPASGADADPDGSVPAAVEDGPVHRQLLRAKLPRPEGQKDTRPLPEFTVRQPGVRDGSFRGDRSKMRSGGSGPMGRGNGGPPNGNRAHGSGRGGFQGRPGQPRNPGGRGPFRGGQPRHGGKKGRG